MKAQSQPPFKPFMINGKVINLQEKDPSIGVKENTFVKYFPSLDCILAGEFIDTDKKKESQGPIPRTSVVTCTNMQTGKTCKKIKNNNSKREFIQVGKAVFKPFILLNTMIKIIYWFLPMFWIFMS